MKTLALQPLSPQAFAPYGTVLHVPADAPGRPINGGTSQRFDLLDDLQMSGAGGRPMLAIFRARARSFPHTVDEMERHALGAQAFVPLARQRFVLVVASAGTPPTDDALAAFVTDGHQGALLAPGTWHHALLAIDAGDFLVLERAAGAVDCDTCRIATPACVAWPAL